MSNFRKLIVWHLASELGKRSYNLSVEIQTSFNRNMCDQLRRSSASIASNISEADDYESASDKARFLTYAIGSASETENHVQALRDINSISYKDHADLTSRVISVRRMLRRLVERVRERIPPKKSRKPRKPRNHAVRGKAKSGQTFLECPPFLLYPPFLFSPPLPAAVVPAF
jgi:four helix bundle protein